MTFIATKQPIGHNHASPPNSFLETLLNWGKTEADEVFAPNDHLGNKDVFNIVAPKLAPNGWQSLTHRKAAMLEVLRVLGGDESDWNWNEGRDTTAGPETPDQMEAGAFQVSYDSRTLGTDLAAFLLSKSILSAYEFQMRIKADPILDCAYTARVLRDNTRWSGPTNIGWLLAQVQPAAVAEWEQLLSA